MSDKPQQLPHVCEENAVEVQTHDRIGGEWGKMTRIMMVNCGVCGKSLRRPAFKEVDG